MENFVCIHGHFYQPPRENPWLEEIEIQDSAYPYHDWNERINFECYAPNSAARLLDAERRIRDIASNYIKISFDFGPTLLSWMEAYANEVYKAIIETDRQSIELRSGHGNALAQAYNHMIMPLANAPDRRTQVLWGITDFKHRFGRFPEGMWLPETAVDLATLDVLAQNNITFTILAPHQAAMVKEINSDKWEDVSGGQIDTRRAYICPLPSGRQINIFFYDGSISKAVAFEGLLKSGEAFADRLLGGFSDAGPQSQILSIATDGESYGHHHKFGDMALAYALNQIESNGAAQLTNYGEYLEKNPAHYEVQISENTSWSCFHGIERWKGPCGCNTGGHPGWNQEWRAPLRVALDWLRDELSTLYENEANQCLKDPWAARDEYIDVILDRSEHQRDSFFTKHAKKELAAAEKISVLKLLEMQRHAMLMYTSCGWFFDELSGIETVQILQYAGRAIQLAGQLAGISLEAPFREKLSEAKSNLPEFENGTTIYERSVKTTEITLGKVAVHYAISSLIRDYGERSRIYSCSVVSEDYQKRQTGEARLVVGKIDVTSEVTFDSETVNFAVLYLGGHLFHGGSQTYPGDEKYQLIKRTLIDNFEKGDVAEIIRLMNEYFGADNYSLKNLFRDEQRRISTFLTTKIMDEFEHSCRDLYDRNRILLSFMHEAGAPLPSDFLTACQFVLNLDMKRMFLENEIDKGKIRDIINDIKKWNIAFDATSMEFTLRNKAEEMINNLRRTPSDMTLLSGLHTTIDLLRSLPVDINFWQVQNAYFIMAKNTYREMFLEAKKGARDAAKWIELFKVIGEMLLFNVPEILEEG